jgi:hypothetical protein
MQLTSMAGGANGAQMVGFDSTLHLVWYQWYFDSLGTYHQETFYKRSTDEGTTWGPPVLLSTQDTKTSVLPKIALSMSDVHVVWNDYGIGTMYRRSTDYGMTWGPIDTLLGNDLTFQNSIAAVGDSVYVVANAPSQRWNVYTWSTDRGMTWSPYRIISYREAQRIPLQVHPPFLHIAKDPLDSTAGTLKTYYLRSPDGGRSWGRDTLISDTDSAGSQEPALAVDYRGNPHVTWYDYRYSPYPWTGDIFYTSSRDSGTAWVPPDSLTAVHRAVRSSILAQGDTLHLVWDDDRNGFDTNFEMYYRMSTDLGISWGPEVRLSYAPGISIFPCLGQTQNFVHLVWVDERDDTLAHWRDIYYKRKSKMSGVPFKEISDRQRQMGASLRILPNPTKGSCLLQVEGEAVKEVHVYNVQGRLIKTLVPEASLLMPFTLRWDGQDDKGKAVPSGVYFIRFLGGGFTRTEKVVVFR